MRQNMDAKLFNELNIDLLNDIFLSSKDILMFYIRHSNKNTLFKNEICQCSGTFKDIGIDFTPYNLDELFSKIDPKSEIAEVRGFDSYVKLFKEDLCQEQTYTLTYLPLLLNGERKYYELKVYKFITKSISIFLITPIDKDLFNIDSLYFHSFKDSLTNLFNFNAFNYHLELSNRNSFFVGFFDIDNFKEINDTFGHKKGDYVLEEIGNTLIEMSDPHIIFYRRSGDEFIFMTTDLDYKTLYRYIVKMKMMIGKIPVPTMKLDVSVGFVQYIQSSKFYDKEDIINLADIAMYMSKRECKGSITFLNEKEIENIINFGSIEDTLKSLITKKL